MHIPVHVLDVPTINEDNDGNDDKVVNFIDKHITCAILDETFYPDLHQLVKQVQTHFHTMTWQKRKVLHFDSVHHGLLLRKH